MSPVTPHNLLDLPAEIRNNVYEHIFQPSANRKINNNETLTYDYRPALKLFFVNKQVYQEARAVFHALNAFVLIETPWEEALGHVATQGKVPIVVPKPGWDYNLWTLKANISAPQWTQAEEKSDSFVIHVDDLPAFAVTWRYSDLSEPLLNPQLSLDLELQDPKIRVKEEEYSDDDEEPKKETETEKEDQAERQEPVVSEQLQRRLLLPFTIVKRLHSTHFHGNPKPAKHVIDELLRGMEEPHESPESCLRKATSYKEMGNSALKAGRYDEAEEMYSQAWLAMHIIVKGRERQILADAWFNRELREEPFKGMQGHNVRLALRVKLVANTVMLYLKMKRFDDARYWGMRTIDMIRHAIGLPENYEASRPEDEAIMNFVGADDMGKIYFRTAMAWKALDEKSEARKLLRVAQIYLPRDRRVAEEIAACSLRLG